MLALTVPVLAGCSSGSGGLVSGEVLDADGAQVLVVDGYGLSLRGTPVDRGLTLGFTRHVYIYPEGTSGLPAPGRHLFWVPQPAEPPVALNGEAIGLDVRASSSSVGLTLGIRGTSILANVPADETVFYRLRFIADDPARTRLRYCVGEDACPTFMPPENWD